MPEINELLTYAFYTTVFVLLSGGVIYFGVVLPARDMAQRPRRLVNHLLTEFEKMTEKFMPVCDQGGTQLTCSSIINGRKCVFEVPVDRHTYGSFVMYIERGKSRDYASFDEAQTDRARSIAQHAFDTWRARHSAAKSMAPT